MTSLIWPYLHHEVTNLILCTPRRHKFDPIYTMRSQIWPNLHHEVTNLTLSTPWGHKFDPIYIMRSHRDNKGVASFILNFSIKYESEFTKIKIVIPLTIKLLSATSSVLSLKSEYPSAPLVHFLLFIWSFAEEIKSRLRSGSACYHSVQNLLPSRLLSKNVKIKIYIEL